MLNSLIGIIEHFVLRLLSGEVLAFFQLIILIVLAFFAQKAWQAMSKSPFFKVVMVVLFCLVAFGFLFIPDRMMAVLSQIGRN